MKWLFKSPRRKAMERRAAMSDADFLQAIGAPAELARPILAARRAVGRICRLAPETIYPEDNPQRLANLCPLDWDDAQFALEFEGELGIELGNDSLPRFLSGRFFWRKWPGSKSFGEWVVLVAKWAQQPNIN